MSESKPAGLSNALTRTIVGAIYFVVVVGCLYAGVTVTALVAALMAGMCAWELLHLFRAAGRQPNDIIVLAACVLFPLSPLAPFGTPTLLLAILLIVSVAAWYVSVPRVTVTDVALTIFIPLYCGFGFSTVTMIRMCNPGIQGFLLAFGVMGSIWLNDAIAYFVGSRFGKTKLAPRISPNKSVEGFVGGLLACIFIWCVVASLKVCGIGFFFAIPCGIIVGIAGVLGDLFESRIKRGFGVKDSGNLLPGHGGMLDRSDALLFGCMVALLILRLGRYL